MNHQKCYVHVAGTFYKIFYFVHEVELTFIDHVHMFAIHVHGLTW
jgi:hypothetical protein